MRPEVQPQPLCLEAERNLIGIFNDPEVKVMGISNKELKIYLVLAKASLQDYEERGTEIRFCVKRILPHSSASMEIFPYRASYRIFL